MNLKLIKPLHPLKIAFVLSARFPTEKAYGVTTRETILALLSTKHDVKIFTRRSSYMDDKFKEIEEIIIPFSENFLTRQVFKYSTLGTALSSKLAWRLGLYIIAKKIPESIGAYNPDVIWTREVEIVNSLSTKFPSAKIVLEVHTKLKHRKFIKVKKHKNQILVCPINDNIYKYLKTFLPTDTNIHIAPMSVNSSFINTKKDIINFVKNLNKDPKRTLQVGYVGKFSPNGYSKGIEVLVDLALKFQNESLNFRVNLVGGTEKEILEYSSLKKRLNIKDKYLNLQGHIPHSDVPEILKSNDILVLTSPLSSTYSGTPLKLLEYLSSGRIVMLPNEKFVIDTNINRVCDWIYDSHNTQDLFRLIMSSIHDPDLVMKISGLIEYASVSTWECRIEEIMKRVKSIKL